MALFVRRPESEDKPLYTTVLDQTKLGTMDQGKTLVIVGLGNIGDEYAGTRHNIGFEILDFCAEKQDFPAWSNKKDLKCLESSKTVEQNKIILIKPTTFMNNSGEALAAVKRFYKVPNTQVLAVYDEVDVNFGQIRTRVGGGSAGHNGVKSLIALCGEDFARVRVGVGPKKPAQMELADFVLGTFGPTHKKQLGLLMTEANALLSEYFYNGKLLEETRSFIF